jgi:hypothetical protein
VELFFFHSINLEQHPSTNNSLTSHNSFFCFRQTKQKLDWHKYLKKDSTSTLNENHIERLIKVVGLGTRNDGPIDYGKELQAAHWTECYQQLVRFQREHGHCNATDAAMKKWVNLQRERFRNRNKQAPTDKKSRHQPVAGIMSTDQVDALAKVVEGALSAALISMRECSSVLHTKLRMVTCAYRQRMKVTANLIAGLP